MLLLLHPNQVLSRDRIIDELWGERPPATAPAALHVYISKLRKTLAAGGAPDILITQESGYALRVEQSQLDSNRFAELAGEGRRALEAGDYATALAELDEALSLWRGPALDDLGDEAFARRAGARLDEARLAAQIDRVDAELARGNATRVVADLEELVAEHPFQEHLWADLMLALYGSGRQADALEAFRRARKALDTLGIEPSPELKRLQAQILQQDPALQAPRDADARSPRPRRTRVRRLVLLIGGLIVAGVVTWFGLTRGGTGAPVVALAQNSVRVIDFQTDEAIASIPVGGTPGGLAVDKRGVWVANEDDGTVLLIDPASMKVARTIGARGVTDVAAGAEAIWVVSNGRFILRIPTEHPDLASSTQLEQLSDAADPPQTPPLIAFGARAVWALHGLDGLARLDPGSGRLVSRIPLPGTAADTIAFGAGSLWVVDGVQRQLIQVDPERERIARKLKFGDGLSGLAIGEGSVWVGDYFGNVLWRINPLLWRVERTIEVGRRPTAVAVGGGFIWVANSHDSTVSKIDPETNEVVRTITVGYIPTRLVVGHDKLWVVTY